MRICITSIPLDTFGGAERVIVSDATYFAEANHDVHLLTSNFETDVVSSYGSLDSIEIHQYPVDRTNRIPGQIYNIRHIRSLLKEIKPDAVIAHYREQETWLSLATLRINPIFAAHIHGSLFWFEDNTERAIHMWKKCAQEIVSEVPGHSEFWSIDHVPWLQNAKDTVSEVMETIAVRSCDAVFVNTRQVSSEIECLYGISPTVNPPGVSLEQPGGKIDSLPIDKPFIFSVSRLDERKRIDLLLRSFAKLRSIRQDVQLVIAGTGDEEKKLRDLASDLGIGENVVFSGYISESMLPHYYSEAEVFVCPGWMSYGLTPLEAVHSQTKVALSTDAFAKEVVGDKSGVKVIDPTVKKWVAGLDELIECDETPSSSDIPTTKTHAEAKLNEIIELYTV